MRTTATASSRLITHSLPAHDAERALFALPAVRVSIDVDGRRRSLFKLRKPDRTHAGDARLSVTGTVARLDREKMTVSFKGWTDGYEFLKDVLAGQRRWHAPGTLPAPWPAAGAWVLEDDLKFAEARVRSEGELEPETTEG